jgi:hypothetical protein
MFFELLMLSDVFLMFLQIGFPIQNPDGIPSESDDSDVLHLLAGAKLAILLSA